MYLKHVDWCIKTPIPSIYMNYTTLLRWGMAISYTTTNGGCEAARSNSVAHGSASENTKKIGNDVMVIKNLKKMFVNH